MNTYIYMWYYVKSYFLCRATYRVLCLGWYKPCEGSQGFSTHKLNSQVMYCSCSVQSCYCGVLVMYSNVLVHQVVFLSLFGASIPCHHCIPTLFDILNNIRQHVET